MIVSRTPMRITLGGGGTDLPSFYSKYGGFVVTMAIDKYIYLTLKPDNFENKIKFRYSQIEVVNSSDELKNTRAKNALMYHNILSSIEINSCADLPSNTGLGSSGTFLVGLLHSIREYKNIGYSPKILAEEACDIEINIMKEPVGKQDQYIAAYGEMQILQIDTAGNVDVRPLKIKNTKEFLSKMHVYYLNVKRDASDILQEQQQLKGNSENLLQIIKEYGHKTVEILESGNFHQYGIMMDEYWKLKKQLSYKISIGAVDSMYDLLKSDYNVLGGKIIGAGGGGFLCLYVDKNPDLLEKKMETCGYKKLDYNLDLYGSKIMANII